jgi:hypothetical protein
MPAYAFEIRWDGGEKVSWTYLPTDESAHNFARILVQNFKSSSQYRGPAQMTVKNNEGAQVILITF